MATKIFLFIMDWPADHSLHLPPIDANIQSSRARSPGDVQVSQTEQGLVISLADPNSQDAIVTVVELTIAGKALEIEPIAVGD